MTILKKTNVKCALTLTVAAGLAGLALPLQAQQNAGSSSSSGTPSTSQNMGGESASTFIKHAQISSEFEKQATQLGAQRAQNPQLKQFAQQIVQQHSENQQQLQSLAQSQGLPQKEALPSRLTQELSQLDQQSGQAFDQKLATCLLKENARSLKQSQRAAQQIQDPQVRQFAQTQQQEQQQHLQKAAQVAQAVGVSQSTIASYTQQAGSAMGGGGESQDQGQMSGSGSSEQPGGSSSGAGGGQSGQNQPSGGGQSGNSSQP